jgi:hypothetical protein
MSKVYQIDNKWYYEDEESFEEVGPFNTEQIAITAYNAIHKWYEKDHRNTIKKMKDNMGI